VLLIIYLDLGDDSVNVDVDYAYQLTSGIVAEGCTAHSFAVFDLRIELWTKLVLRYGFSFLYTHVDTPRRVVAGFYLVANIPSRIACQQAGTRSLLQCRASTYRSFRGQESCTSCMG
jgi:hypothetical protein